MLQTPLSQIAGSEALISRMKPEVLRTSITMRGSADCLTVAEVPETRFAETPSGRIAYQVVGEGLIDVLVTHSPMFPLTSCGTSLLHLRGDRDRNRRDVPRQPAPETPSSSGITPSRCRPSPRKEPELYLLRATVATPKKRRRENRANDVALAPGA